MYKKSFNTVLMILIMLFMTLSFTLAFFSATINVKNIITFAEVNSEVIELTEDNQVFPTEGIKNFMPGDIVVKEVYVKNSAKHSIWVRAQIKMTFENNENLNPEDVITLDLNTEDWIFKDGFYYDKQNLTSNITSSSLLEKVNFSKDAGNDYKNERLLISVYIQAVQSDFNGETVFDAKGWSE